MPGLQTTAKHIWACRCLFEQQAALQACGKQPPPSALTAELFRRRVKCSQHRTQQQASSA